MTTKGGEDRRVRDAAVAVLLILALAVVAIAVSAAGGTLTPSDDPTPTTDDPGIDRSVLIGGGSHGDAAQNPIGSPSGNETNPFQSRSTEIQFYVETDHPGYWRIDAYDTYTDGSWIRTGDTEDYRELSAQGPVTGEISHTVTLEQPAAALPTTWQPATVTSTDDPELQVSPETGLQATTPIDDGATYTVESYCYTPDPSQLRDAGEDYPEVIEDRYTTVPESVPTRVATLSDEITNDANSSIAAAAAISAWLATNTAYSLEAEYDLDDGDPIDQFLFDDQAGTAEHKAASTVLLLRSQGIPARYVTGYAPGEALEHADDTYAVRGIHAHAWAEIYIPDHGWIPIDPTPTADRIAVENSLVETDGEMIDTPVTGECPVPADTDDDTQEPPTEDDPEGDVDDPEETNGNETDGEPADDSENETTEDDPETPPVEAPSGINITLSEPVPSPGEQLTVTATRSDDPVTNATVFFNDDRIGTTNASGQVTGAVPYSDTLHINVTTEPTPEPESLGMPPGASPLTPAPDGGGVTDGTLLASVTQPQLQTENQSVSVPLTANFDVQSDPTPLVVGGNATAHVILNDDPLPDADVYLNGEQVAITNQDGTATFTIPENITADAEESVTMTVRRGDLETEHVAAVGRLNVTAGTDRTLALPGQTVTVTATVDETPVEGATIFKGDDPVGTTDENGTASVTMATGLTTSVAASFVGQHATTTIDNLLLPVTLFGVILFGGVSGVFVILNNRYGAAQHVRSRSFGISRRLVETVASVLFWIEKLPQAVSERSDRRWKPTGIPTRRAIVAIAAWLAKLPRRGVRGLLALMNALYRLLRAIIGGRGRSPTAVPDADGQTSTDTASHQSVRSAWFAFVRLVAKRIEPTATPGAIARQAIKKGFPRQPVRQLTDAFRTAEYGPETTDPPLDAASEALTTIKREAKSAEGADRDSEDDRTANN